LNCIKEDVTRDNRGVGRRCLSPKCLVTSKRFKGNLSIGGRMENASFKISSLSKQPRHQISLTVGAV